MKRPARLSWAQTSRARAAESVIGSAGLGGHVAVWPSQRMPTIATIRLRRSSTKLWPIGVSTGWSGTQEPGGGDDPLDCKHRARGLHARAHLVRRRPADGAHVDDDPAELLREELLPLWLNADPDHHLPSAAGRGTCEAAGDDDLLRSARPQLDQARLDLIVLHLGDDLVRGSLRHRAGRLAGCPGGGLAGCPAAAAPPGPGWAGSSGRAFFGGSTITTGVSISTGGGSGAAAGEQIPSGVACAPMLSVQMFAVPLLRFPTDASRQSKCRRR